MNNSVQQTVAEKVTQLEEARILGLKDSALYPHIVQGVLPLIGSGAALELRRWGSEFLAETFASPAFPIDQKQQLSVKVLDVLKDYLDIPGEDAAVIKSVVQTATSVYPLVFRHIIYNPSDTATWQKMAAIKSNILRRMDAAPSGVRVCCTKFIQRIVLVQTPGLIADPRRPDQNELSLALVPRDHPLIPPPTLEAEAFGLLDRLLNLFQETPSDVLLVTSTLNCIGGLVRSRASIANRILSTILNFNPFKDVKPQADRRTKVVVKSMERTVRAFLLNLNKRNPNHPLAGRVQVYLERLQQLRADFLDDGTRKRPAPVEPTDGLDSVKRQRLGAEVPDTPPPQDFTALPLPPGPISVAQLFTLTRDEGLRSFDVQAIPIDVVNKILVPILNSIDPTQLDRAVNAVRSRYLSLSRPPPVSPLGAAQVATGYISNEQPVSDVAEQVINRLDNADALGLPLVRPPDVSLGPFVIPQPPVLSQDEVNEYGKGTVNRVFGMVNGLVEAPSKSARTGFNRLAASGHDRDAWVTVVSRLATRPLAGLETAIESIKKEGDYERAISKHTFAIPDAIREAMHIYVLDDFRKRIDVGITWLNEEWYNDQLQLREGGSPLLHYERLALKLLDAIVPYLDAKDLKVIIRFLSEIPGMNTDILERIKRLARDPERVSLAVNAIHYLALFRPPSRSICIDALEDLWRNYDDARAASAKVLQRWRPQLLSTEIKSEPPSASQAVQPAVTA